MADRWIQKAIKHPGSFTAQAKRAGKSVAAFRRSVLSSPGRYRATTRRRARLTRTLSKLSRGR